MITGSETAHLMARPMPVIADARLPVVEAKVAADLNLRDGQVVQATLQANLQSLKFQNWDMRLPLTAAQSEILARWISPDNSTLKLRVQVLPNGSIVLRPQAPSINTTLNPPPELPALQAARLQQLSLRPAGLGSWAELLKPGILETLLQTTVGVDSEARKRLLGSLQLRPSTGRLSGDRIRDWVQRSGVGLERALSQSKDVSPVDFKAALRALLEELSQNDSIHAQKVQQVIDDIESSQLLASQNQIGRDWSFSFVLPFRDANPVTIRFSRGQPRDAQGSMRMTIDLHTESDGLGEIWMRSHIIDLKEVDLVMWTTNEPLARQARAGAGNLAQELQGLGLVMTGMQVIDGPRPEESVGVAADDSHLGHLLDLRT